MEVKKNVLKQMVRGLEYCKECAQNTFDFYIEQISECKTVESVMEHKKDLLLKLAHEIFPLYGDTCYFCIDTDGDCKICKFAKFHRKCETNKKSDYNRILKAIDKLEAVFDNYYRDEVYPEDAIPTKRNQNKKMFKKYPGEEPL